MRLAPIGAVTGALLDFSGSDDFPTTGPALSSGSSGNPFTPGAYLETAPMDAVDTGTNVPNWGACELMYVTSTSASAFTAGQLVHVDKDFNILVVPATNFTGRPIYVVLTAFAVGSVTRQGGWVLRSGICPVQFSVAATAGPMYVGTAGLATPTSAAGRAISNATTLIAAASAFTRQVTSQNGSKFIRTSRVNGIFIGQTISGTGISGVVASIDPGGNGFTSSIASSASATVTGTFTPTGFGICHVDRASVSSTVA